MTSIEGTVLEINFRNDENGWTVMDIDFGGTLTTAVGCLPHIHAGEFVRLFGAWTEHKIYGMQFSVKSVETRLPNTAESIRMFLSSGLVKGVGEGLATRIVDEFGEDTFDVIENSPELLAGVRGISQKMARNIAESFFGARWHQADHHRYAEPWAFRQAGVSRVRAIRRGCARADRRESVSYDR